jgi:maltose O-acetyltransferase
MGVVFDCMAPITLGRQVYVGHQVLVLSSTHEPGRDGRAIGKPVTIGDGAWIGARTVILPGSRSERAARSRPVPSSAATASRA